MRPNVLCLAFLVVASCHAQQAPSWREQWDAFDYAIPMRDGVKLHTVVYVPKTKAGPFPILMERTPYGAGTAANRPPRVASKLMDSGYIFAYQDVRGRERSEGEWMNVRPILPKGKPGADESTDTYDTIEFLLKNVPQNSGRVGLWGISYPGFYAGAGAVRNHPALKAISPQAPVNDWFLGDDVRHNGAFFIQENFDFSLGFDVPKGVTPPRVERGGKSAYDFFLGVGALRNFDEKLLKGTIPYWNEIVENDTYNAYWKARALWRSFRDVGCAVLTVGGWFDKEDMFGALTLYKRGEEQNPGIPNYLVMGPWSHGGWAGGPGTSLNELPWGQPTGQWYRDNVEFPFFERYLKGDESVKPPAEATVFETGANTWQTYDIWPPKDAKPTSLYLGADKGLTWTKPTGEGRDTYVNDPAKPTPYLADFATSRGAPGDWLARNQEFFTTRADVLTYVGTPQKEPLRIGGPITVDFWVTTTGTDMDLIVKVLDIFPADSDEKSPSGRSLANYHMMVRGDVFRGKFRNSFERPEAFVPGRPTRIRFTLNDALHTFRPGHRIGIQVQSSWFPIVDRNPNTFLPIAKAKDSDYRPATISILRSAKYPTRVEFGVLP